ncbi:DUF4926 domain-containing protein [Mycolicibacterium llatzerense]|uniref:DUF4926 domain-containing protein n=1 Tax=Mycolicibacterium llatzerense TaxID=280871 RepID=UPI0008DC7C5C|nr:DUF4926 domain-containing protein [Mycolicibacterium llatzerense]
MTFQEHEGVVLPRDLPEAGLVAGTVGAVVWLYPGGEDFEVEFFDADGNTIDVVTVSENDIQPRVTP